MKIRTIFLLIICAFFISCNKSLAPSSTAFILIVNSEKVDCMGVSPMRCLQVKKDGETEWENFYDAIEGFNFEAGYLYTLKVNSQKIPEQQVPADGSNIKYTLVKILEKQAKVTYQLHDIWALTGIQGNLIDLTDKQPTIEIQLNESIYLGFDGCNTIRGLIEFNNTAIIFKPGISTKKACFNTTIDRQFTNALHLVNRYEIRENILYLYQDNDLLLNFKKVD